MFKTIRVSILRLALATAIHRSKDTSFRFQD
jgi:hypothetical protein